jgi:hypothetical protein
VAAGDFPRFDPAFVFRKNLLRKNRSRRGGGTAVFREVEIGRLPKRPPDRREVRDTGGRVNRFLGC